MAALNKIKISEDTVSMFLGLLIVMVIIGLVYNFFQKRRGDVLVPGVTNNSENAEKQTNKEVVSGGKYKVVAGDNLWRIAETKLGNGFLWTEIAKKNNLENPSVLAVGTELELPEIITKNDNKNEASNKTETKEYTVVRGDHLWKIAVENYTDGFKWVEIWKANQDKIRDPNLLEVGTKLMLPSL